MAIFVKRSIGKGLDYEKQDVSPVNQLGITMKTEVEAGTGAMQGRKLPVIESIYHPTDFSRSSLVAFGHALRLCLDSHARLHVHHVFKPHQKFSWDDYPGVRDFLQGWKLVSEDHEHDDLKKLDLHVEKVLSESKSPLMSMSGFVEKHRPDLIVLSTHQNYGVMAWIQKEKALPLTRMSHCATLFIPYGEGGFVSLSDGQVKLRNVLVPVDVSPSPSKAIEAAEKLVNSLNVDQVNVHTLHVGTTDKAPALKLPDSNPAINWSHLVVKGHKETKILQAAEQMQADVIVMATAGTHGFLDALRGSTTDHIIHHANCPVLAVPE